MFTGPGPVLPPVGVPDDDDDHDDDGHLAHVAGDVPDALAGRRRGPPGTADVDLTSVDEHVAVGAAQPGSRRPGHLVGGHDVVLLDTFTVNGVDTVQVEVDGQVYDVAEGDTFGPGNSFELMSVSGNCAAFVFGDESFTLCVRPQK